MLNHISLMGRLTRDPQLRNANERAVCNFTLACDRDREGPCDFIDCVAWGGTAEFISKYFRKGQLYAVTGRLQIRKWEGKDGTNHTSAEVVVESAYFCERRNE